MINAPAGEPWEELHRYWLSRHVGDRPPSRAEIDPAVDIAHLAGNLMILDIMPDGYRYRFYGSAIAQRHGLDMTGRMLGSTGINSDAMRQCRIAFDEVVALQKPRMLIARIKGVHTAKQILLALPLVLQDGETEKILAGSFYDGYIEPGTPILGMQPFEAELAAGAKF
jgi:hypothetical protein